MITYDILLSVGESVWIERIRERITSKKMNREQRNVFEKRGIVSIRFRLKVC